MSTLALKALRERREELSIGLREAARRAGVSATHYADVEQGKAAPSSQVGAAILDALQTPISVRRLCVDQWSSDDLRRVEEWSAAYGDEGQKLRSKSSIQRQIRNIDLALPFTDDGMAYDMARAWIAALRWVLGDPNASEIPDGAKERERIAANLAAIDSLADGDVVILPGGGRWACDECGNFYAAGTVGSPMPYEHSERGLFLWQYEGREIFKLCAYAPGFKVVKVGEGL